jgi:16S rRNA (adenine1518-N6/adenine1519-N6)-dimethyltransferase
MSGVLKITRRKDSLDCDEVLFKKVVKAAFNQRRKTMRNSLKELVNDKYLMQNEVFNLRPEQISVQHFVDLTNLIAAARKQI